MTEAEPQIDAADARQQRILDLHADIRRIKNQIASATLEHAAGIEPIDPRWLRKARYAKQKKVEALERLLAQPAPPRPKPPPPKREAFEDTLIDVLRARHDDLAWSAVMDEAVRRHREVYPKAVVDG